MDVERARAFLLKLPHVVETVQWGNNLVFWVGDKAVGGKMFVLIDLDGGKAAVSYAAGAERYGELMEIDGMLPAPYFARIFWAAAEDWRVHRDLDWERELAAAHEITLRKLAPKVLRVLAMPAKERKKAIAEARKAKK